MKLSELSRRPVSFPKDWTRTKIGDIGTLKSGSTPDRNKVDVYFRSGTIPWVKTLDLNNGLLIDTQEKITERALAETSCSIIPKGSVLVAMYGGFNQIGRTGLLSIDAAINQALTAITITNGELEPAYLLYWLNTFVGAWRRLAASSRKDPNITRQDVGSFPLAYPRVQEQRKICEIASLWRTAIEQTEKLIAAKVKRKRGLMQQLLTGKRQFSPSTLNDWTWLILGEVASESRVRNNGTLDSNALMAVTKAQGMIPMRERVQGASVERCKVVSKDWFAYNPMRLNIGSIAKWEGDEDVLVSPDYVVFKCNEARLHPDFLNHFRRTRQWSSFVERSGDGSVRVRIYFSHLASLKLHLPPIDEQRRIAQFLNACDKEIALLKLQLGALKRQKRGLMQKLLTGQIRVKVDETEAVTVEAG